MLLQEIQSLENKLIYSDNCGSYSAIFTEMMYKTSEWIDKEPLGKIVHISPYKTELDKTIDMVAYYIECGSITDDAFSLAGVSRNTVKPKMTKTHCDILEAARKIRIVNKNKNKSKNK
jgi:hypothetical protein